MKNNNRPKYALSTLALAPMSNSFADEGTAFALEAVELAFGFIGTYTSG